MNNVDKVLSVFDKYESLQARVPAGSPNGGQWVSRGAGSMGLGPSTTTDTPQSLARLHGLHRRGVGAIETEEFGPVTGPELAQHKAAGWDDPTILAAIRKSNAVMVTVGPTDTEGVGDNSHFATGRDGERYIHIAPHQQNGSTFRHEYGHYLDSEMRRQHYLGSEQVLPAVARDLRSDEHWYAGDYFNKLPAVDSQPKRRLLDLVSAFTDCELGKGHSKEYYSANFPSLPTSFEKVTVRTKVVYLGSAHASEAFANYISLRGASDGRPFLDVARKMFPNAISTFDDMLDRYTRIQKLWELLSSMDIRSS